MKKHRPDLVSLIFGLIFLFIAAGWLGRHIISIDVPDAGWFFAGGLILVGLISLVAAVRNVGSKNE
jgi:hypothetical protein